MPQVPTIEVIKFVLWVRGMERAVRFFRDVMGLAVRFQSDGWSEVGRGDVVIGLHAGADERPRQTGLSFQVADLDAIIAAVAAAGVQVTQAPTTRPGEPVRLAEVLDREGNLWMLTERV